ncbi:MAG: glucuronate isomerase [Lactobacillaceae bacterium]|nr:glucuronate isomerase [Lactobacillaceae bacterium]
MALLDEKFLLQSEFAVALYEKYAKDENIIDYHCHLSPQEIYENKPYKNLTEIWLGGDHYKWRLLRANGVDEKYITGNGDDYEKYLAFVRVMQNAVGNPIFEWSHNELKRYFGIHELLTEDNAKSVWDRANALLATPEFTPRELMKGMKVKLACTTDDPADDLKYHQLLAEEEGAFKLLPTFRPDNVWEITPDFASYLTKLGNVTDLKVDSFAKMVEALTKRVDYFKSIGGVLADTGMNNFKFIAATESEVESIFAKAVAGNALTLEETYKYQTALMLALLKMYHDADWTVQIHMNVLRSANKRGLREIGANTGFDSIGSQPAIADEIALLMSAAEDQDALPRTILYSLNANDMLPLATIAGSFQSGNRQKIQIGSGWWFLDTASGMHNQLTIFAEQSLLGNFVGMLTDSRSLLSYPRHEYFRRVLCNFLGELVEQGRAPEDLEYLGRLVTRISGQNCLDYLGLTVD